LLHAFVVGRRMMLMRCIFCLAGYFKTPAWRQSLSLVIKKQARDRLTMRTLAPSKLFHPGFSLRAFPSELFFFQQAGPSESHPSSYRYQYQYSTSSGTTSNTYYKNTTTTDYNATDYATVVLITTALITTTYYLLPLKH
jgi:hypothetical protein